MIDKPTVFILGAGASHPYGFPTARELRTDIVDHFQNRYEKHVGHSGEDIYHQLLQHGYPGPDLAKAFVESFDRSSTESVDLFLSRHHKLEKIGKMAICLSILDAERSSRFGDRVAEPEEDWYFHLYNKLTRELTGSGAYRELAKNSISFVTFNYDRSLEFFLFDSLRHSFEDASESGVAEVLLSTPIVHVYGQIAPLPWQNPDEWQVLPYGRDLGDTKPNLLQIINNIHVVHELRTNPELDKARKLIQEAQQIFFLGFGYAKENLEALGFPEVLTREHVIFGTAMDARPKEIGDLQDSFARGLAASIPLASPSHVQIGRWDCVALLREFL
jgi:hypothetical protein